MEKTLLKIKDLTVTVGDNAGTLILDHTSLEVPELSITALVGGSGSGKSTTGLAILGLLPLGLNRQGGSIMFGGEELVGAKEDRWRQIRGGSIGMVFQEPLIAFNPVFSIGDQIDEVLQVHTKLNRAQRRSKVLDLLEITGLPEPERALRAYPHQLSGGMRQRAMIAQAIAADPQLIIADEPTSNLDVTLQARIIDLFRELKQKLDLTILLITHDLGLVAHTADRVAVMTEGKVVEFGTTDDVLNHPAHEYTKLLMEAA